MLLAIWKSGNGLMLIKQCSAESDRRPCQTFFISLTFVIYLKAQLFIFFGFLPILQLHIILYLFVQNLSVYFTKPTSYESSIVCAWFVCIQLYLYFLCAKPLRVSCQTFFISVKAQLFVSLQQTIICLFVHFSQKRHTIICVFALNLLPEKFPQYRDGSNGLPKDRIWRFSITLRIFRERRPRYIYDR